MKTPQGSSTLGGGLKAHRQQSQNIIEGRVLRSSGAPNAPRVGDGGDRFEGVRTRAWHLNYWDACPPQWKT
eukprot:756617-Alexandrium_andersonii.AAC.2